MTEKLGPLETKSMDRSVRNRILMSALHLYNANGYFNTSVHDVQRDADVAIGSIYKHFGGKEGIAEALYETLVERMDTIVSDVIAGLGNAQERCRAVALALFELTESEPETVSFILHAKHREFLPHVTPLCRSSPFVKLREVVLQGQKNGEIRRLDGWVAVASVFGAVIRMIQLRLDGVLTEPLTSYFDELWETAWRGVSA